MLRKKQQNQTGNYPLSRFIKCNRDCTPRLHSPTLYALRIQRKTHQPLIIKLCIIKSIWGKIHIANIHVWASIIFCIWSHNPWREHKSSVWSLNYLCLFLYLSLFIFRQPQHIRFFDGHCLNGPQQKSAKVASRLDVDDDPMGSMSIPIPFIQRSKRKSDKKNNAFSANNTD